MTEQPNLRQFLDEMSSYTEAEGSGTSPPSAVSPIGQVLEIAGSGSRVAMDTSRLMELQAHADPSIAMSGQVGSQVKMKVAGSWLIANVRPLRTGDEPGTV